MIILSPAKTLSDNPPRAYKSSKIRFPQEAETLTAILRKQSASDLKSMMKVSDNIAELNVKRFRDFSLPFDQKDTPTAIHSFMGDAYRALEIEDWTGHDLNHAQKKLRILSGLYGLLRPLDLIHPYRLEMGTSLQTPFGKGLYAFWGDKITSLLDQDIIESKSKFLINLASKEYWAAVDKEKLSVPVIDVHFRELRNGELKFVSFNAKRARGLMTRYMIQNRVTSLAAARRFSAEQYQYSPDLSSKAAWYFVR